MSEEILEPELPIVDPHHHFWDRPLAALFPGSDHPLIRAIAPVRRYMLEELVADARGGGHNVVATVYLECHSFYRADGPPDLRSLGETETVARLAAQSESGAYGPFRACAGIVGHVDLTLGDRVPELLQAHINAGGGRFRGVRNAASYDDDEAMTGPARGPGAGLYLREDFRQGFRHLAPLGLTFDANVFEPQLPDVIDLARAFPETTIVLDHLATPVGSGRYAGRREERFPLWRRNMAELATCANVVVKLGGLGMCYPNFPSLLAEPRASSERLAQEWRPYVHSAIELFGAERCMFESNFPIDIGTASYARLWNALKRLAAGASSDEKTALFSGVARRVYRLQPPAA